MDNRFALVEFQDNQLLTIFDGQTVRVAMKPIAEGLGIDWRSQRQKIIGDPVLSKGVALSTTPSEGGPQQTLTLPLDLMQGWLFKLNPERVAPEAREKVISYQRECYQVLHDYWVKGAAINPRMAGQIEHSDRTTRRRELPGLMDRIEREKHPEKRRVLYELIVRACDAEGITPPTLVSLAPRAEEEEEAERVMIAIDNLVDRYPELNHHRQPSMIAVRRRDMVAHGIMPTKALCEHPRFRMDGTVNGHHGRGVKCWVFLRVDPKAGNGGLPR